MTDALRRKSLTQTPAKRDPPSGGGYMMAGVGDVDGDGLDDLTLGNPLEDTSGTNAGATFLFVGPFAGDPYLSRATATFLAEYTLDGAGPVARAGDVDVDGRVIATFTGMFPSMRNGFGGTFDPLEAYLAGA